MSSHPADTTPAAWNAQLTAWRRMGGERRLLTAMRMSDDIRNVSAAGITHRHPEYDQREVRWALDRMVLGDDLFTKAFPSAPLLSA